MCLQFAHSAVSEKPVGKTLTIAVKYLTLEGNRFRSPQPRRRAMRTLRSVLLAAALVICLSGSDAAADTQLLTITAQVGNFCVFDELNALDFGNVIPGNSVQVTTTLRWTCGAGTGWTLSDETNPGVADGSYSGNLTMPGGLNPLPFSFTYTNITGTSTGAQETSDVTGDLSVPANQVTGSYSATVNMIIEP
jgi:spore coat protein U-like protein